MNHAWLTYGEAEAGLCSYGELEQGWSSSPDAPVQLLGTWHSEQPPRLAFLWVASLWVVSLASYLQGSLGSAWGSKGQMLSFRTMI